MAVDITVDTPIATFNRYINKSEQYPVCAEALAWMDDNRFKNKRMQFVMDTFVSEAPTHPEYSGWAIWNLRLWRQYIDSYLRMGFISVVTDPMDAYLLLKHCTEDGAGWDWTADELAAIRAKFRGGKLPNVPDAETL